MAKLSNRFWFKLHGLFSLPIWIIFCFVCLTGTISVISHELTWLTNPDSRASNPQQLAEKPKSQLVDIVQKAYPTASISTVMSFESYIANTVIFTDSDKPYAIAYVNQYTGEIQEVIQGLTFKSFMRSLHAWLFFPWQNGYSIGYYLVCFMAFVMLGALVSGLMIYKKFWRSYTQPKLRIHQGKKTFLADLHRLAGVWSMWFLILMSITGLWYLAQAIMWQNDIEIEAHAPVVEVSQLPYGVADTPVRPYSLADAVNIAEQKFPNFKSTYIMLPEHFRDTYKVYGEGDGIFYDQYSYGVTVNPWNGKVESERSPEKMNALQTLSHIANPLHYGNIGGLWTKIIWFIFGALLTGMSITGFLIWGGRTVKAAKDTDNQRSIFSKVPATHLVQQDGK
ncbi:PepSY-associated TM helix domain-containing protein [Shewanella japonica]|uniref:PepSY-associated TM helix domain protein n=1 Tax=Shewanella japonica TaxID=93973 RepID=A0ABN4YM16_9GAMM|nr:PepSY-associated TM helix domain-containing protein [Shewanella japonica]ARD23617.1 PepSY-associated TM helix domain protein [Shewanella japonica]